MRELTKIIHKNNIMLKEALKGAYEKLHSAGIEYAAARKVIGDLKDENRKLQDENQKLKAELSKCTSNR